MKNGKLPSAERGMKLFRAAILPVSFCTSLIDCGSSMLQRAAILSGLASMPLVETRHPKTISLVDTKHTFFGVKTQVCFPKVREGFCQI